MIRLLGENDRDDALAFLDRDHELNLVMIYDIIHFGLEDGGLPFQGRYYGTFREGKLGGMAAHFNLGSLFIYTPDPDLAPELEEHIAGLEDKPRFVIGRTEWAGPLLRKLDDRGYKPRGLEEQEYMVLTPERFRPRPGSDARFAEPGDLERLIELNRGFQLEYFGELTAAEEELGKMADVRMRDSGIAVVVVDGEIVSKAEIMVRTSKAALIGGVFTAPEHRGKGFSFACMSLLCEGILAGIGMACLNVANENGPAQRVYRGIGFEKICDYSMAHFA